MNSHPLKTHQRQVHLDFLTSPFVPHVGVKFDAKSFAQTFKRAHVNSVTVFAKRHHGMCYYPTRIGTSYPALKAKDLLGTGLFLQQSPEGDFISQAKPMAENDAKSDTGKLDLALRS